MTTKVFLIIPTLHIGGAEKRFLSFWLYARINTPIRIGLVITPKLYDYACKVPELEEIRKYANEIHFLDWAGGSFLKLRSCLKQFYLTHDSPGILFHYVMSFPLFIHSNSDKTLFSFTESSLKNLNFKARLITWISFWEAKYLDILDPKVVIKIKRFLKSKENRIFQTSNSFVDSSAFMSAEVDKKKNWLVFLGRFVDVKQVIPFVRSIPSIYQLLIKTTDKDQLKFFILGHGNQEETIRQLISTPPYKDINITVGFEPNPAKIMKYAKVFYSLQKNTNYPSKSLLEALSCQNIPLVTDVGDTRKIAHPDFSFYVPENFTPQQIAKKTSEIFSLPPEELENRMKMARVFVQKHYTLEKMAEYYLGIYNSIQSS